MAKLVRIASTEKAHSPPYADMGVVSGPLHMSSYDGWPLLATCVCGWGVRSHPLDSAGGLDDPVPIKTHHNNKGRTILMRDWLMTERFACLSQKQLSIITGAGEGSCFCNLSCADAF